jgi:hypothetical protein
MPPPAPTFLACNAGSAVLPLLIGFTCAKQWGELADMLRQPPPVDFKFRNRKLRKLEATAGRVGVGGKVPGVVVAHVDRIATVIHQATLSSLLEWFKR